MKEIRVVFYKPKIDRHVTDNAIAIWTAIVNIPYILKMAGWNLKRAWELLKASNYSHVEIWEADSDGDFTARDFFDPNGTYIYGTCSTSTMRGNSKGTVTRFADTVIHNLKRWAFATYYLTNEGYKHASTYRDTEVKNNKGYGFRDLGKFFGLRFLADPKRNICSEFVNNYLWCAYIVCKPGVIDPRRLALIILGQGKEIIGLEKVQ